MGPSNPTCPVADMPDQAACRIQRHPHALKTPPGHPPEYHTGPGLPLLRTLARGDGQPVLRMIRPALSPASDTSRSTAITAL